VDVFKYKNCDVIEHLEAHHINKIEKYYKSKDLSKLQKNLIEKKI